MNYLGLTQSELEEAGGYWTAREIAQQPALWTEIEHGMMREAAMLRNFLDPLQSRKDLRVVLTGAGTSAFVGECLVPSLIRRTGLRAAAVATTDLVGSPASWLPTDAPLLLVSFARSGNSPESVAALTIAEQAAPECHHLIITCNRDGDLHRRGREMRNAYVVLLPEKADDRGFAMTSSFSGMLLAAALAFGLLTDQSRPAALAQWADQVLEAALPLAAQLARTGHDRVVYLGSNELKGLAHEAALKMLELTDGRVVCVSETPLGFRHGPKTIVNANTLVIVFLCNDPHTRRYEMDVLNELRADGVAARVIDLAAGRPGDPADGHQVRVPGALHAPDLGLCFPYAVFAQCLAFLQSQALGLRPDQPNARGVVNRVVQGVKIYPWSRGR